MKNNLDLIKEEALSYIHHQIGNLDTREKQMLFVHCILVFDKTFYDAINCSLMTQMPSPFTTTFYVMVILSLFH